MNNYYVRGKSDNQLTNLYKVDEKGSIEMYYGAGKWEKDFVGKGNALADISGFGGSWYNIDEIEQGEVEGVIEVLELRYKARKLFGYDPAVRLEKVRK